MDVVFLVGRVLFALIFLSAVATHFGRQGVEYARMYGAPAPELLVPLSGVAAVAGGLSVATGVLADVGALLIVAFLVGITPFMHAFWKEQDPQAKANQQAQFMKNVAMLGGALVIFYVYNQLQGEAGLSITDPVFSRGG